MRVVQQNEKRPILNVSSDETEMIRQLRRYLTDKLTYLLEQPGTIGIGVSGGSMPRVFSKAILGLPESVLVWKRIRLFMIDERVVPIDDEDSNLGAYQKCFPEDLWYVFVPISVYRDAAMTASNYENNLRRILLPEQMGTLPKFDLLFLGCGTDGHTASIFPGRDRLEKVTEFNWVSAITDSPKLPPVRVTLTMPCFKYAKNVAFIIQGAAKSPVVRAIYDRDMTVPAAQARPYNDNFTLFIDEEAGKLLPAIRFDSDEEDDEEEGQSPPPPFVA